MTSDLDEFLDHEFLGCAFAAYVEQAILAKDWPKSEAVKWHAYRFYEESLADRNRQKPQAAATPDRCDDSEHEEAV